MHIKPLTQNGPELEGDFKIDDLIIFSDSGQLASVAKMWSAVTKYALMMDQAHAESIGGVRAFLTARSKCQSADEDELDARIMATHELQILSDSDNYLLKSMLFLMLVSFSEFTHKAIYGLVKAEGPAPPPKHAFKFITKALSECGVIGQVPATYQQQFTNHIDPVRNSFAHGDWQELQLSLAAVDLAQSFQAVAQYFYTVQENLRNQGFNV